MNRNEYLVMDDTLEAIGIEFTPDLIALVEESSERLDEEVMKILAQ